MNKKFLILGVILVLGLFLISGCSLINSDAVGQRIIEENGDDRGLVLIDDWTRCSGYDDDCGGSFPYAFCENGAHVACSGTTTL